MLSCPAPFPFAGSSGFLAVSGDPVTILRRNADSTCLVRLDHRAADGALRDASGNTTVPLADIFETEREATAPRTDPRKPRRKRRA